MLGLFISCMNGIGNQIANGNSLSDLVGGGSSVIDILQDESADNILNVSVTYYDNPNVDPKAAHNFSQFFAADSIRDCVVKIPEGMTNASLVEGTHIQINCDPEKMKYLVCPLVKAEYLKDDTLYDVPLIIKVDSYNAESGMLKGSLITGHYDYESQKYVLHPAIGSKNFARNDMSNLFEYHDVVLFALSDIPDLSTISEDSRYSAFILESDCPAIRKDAKKGDVFVFGQSGYQMEQVDSDEQAPVADSWIKLYSLQDKLAKLLKSKDRKFSINVDGEDIELQPKAFLFDQEFSSHTEYDKGKFSFIIDSDCDGDRVNTVIYPTSDMLPFEDHFYLFEKLVVEDIQGYDPDGKTRTEDPLVLLIISKDNASGFPIVRALNGYKNSPDDYACMIPEIPAGSKITILDDREKVTPTLALMLNDLKLKVNDIERECRRGELIALVGDKIIPVEFDTFFRE